MDASWPGWTLAQSGISAGAGLLGVLVGALMTARTQKKERHQAHIQQQLREFYSPMLGMQEEILAKQDTTEKMTEIAAKIRDSELKGTTSEERRKILVTTNPMFLKLGTYSAEQWRREIFPLYESMLDFFGKTMWLAEPSTRRLYRPLVHYVEVWRRQKKDALHDDMVDILFDETFGIAEIKTLYEDLQSHFERLTKKLTD